MQTNDETQSHVLNKITIFILTDELLLPYRLISASQSHQIESNSLPLIHLKPFPRRLDVFNKIVLVYSLNFLKSDYICFFTCVRRKGAGHVTQKNDQNKAQQTHFCGYSCLSQIQFQRLETSPGLKIAGIFKAI